MEYAGMMNDVTKTNSYSGPSWLLFVLTGIIIITVALCYDGKVNYLMSRHTLLPFVSCHLYCPNMTKQVYCGVYVYL